MMIRSEFSIEAAAEPTLLQKLNGRWHEVALWLYMIVVFGHWLEHIVQAFQVFVLGWARPDAGGVLGLWYPWLATTEILHLAYNTLLLGGLILLRPGFTGRARALWTLSLAVQAWHFFEHLHLQIQYLSGYYIYGALKQTSILELWIPRVELHFLYNSIVFLPMALALYYHLYPPRNEAAAPCGCARRD